MLYTLAVLEKLRALAKEHADLQASYSSPDVLGNPKELARVGKRIKELEPLIDLLADYDRLQRSISDAKDASLEGELREMAEAEAKEAQAQLPALEERMRAFLVPKDPDDDKSVILEVRAGAGGDEASLFAAELLRMYLRFAEAQGWKTEMLEQSIMDGGGLKEAECRIEGAGAYGMLKYESGVHRVQRIPETEAKGRIHTSTATVAILPEAEEVDIKIRQEDLKIDTFRSGGAGGQNVNKVESAIRITHIPTGTVVACQTERSQLKNRELAMSLLRSRIYSAEQEKRAKERGDLRSGQVGSGDRSEKIRTYNFPQDRLTDHRIEQNFSNLPSIMEGNIEKMLQTLREADIEQRLKKMAE